MVKVIKATRLVPIEFDVAWGRYQRGDTGGVRLGDVAPIIAGKVGRLANIPSDVETEELDDDAVFADLKQTTTKTKEELNRERMSAVEIPDNWLELHHLQRLKIAADIRGAKVDTVELADATIRDELVRRGKAVGQFAVGNAAAGTLANQDDGGPNIPPASGVVAGVAQGDASARAEEAAKKNPPAPARPSATGPQPGSASAVAAEQARNQPQGGAARPAAAPAART